jgi:hypothetical protein
MSNRFHSKYHRTNHHTDTKIALLETDANGVPTNPDTGHDPIASPEHPFMGLFALKGGLSACVSDTNPLKTAGFFISRRPTEDACRFSGNVKLSGNFVMDDDLIHADTDINKVGIKINPSTYTNYDLIVNQSLYVIENTNTKTLSADFVRINTTGSYDTYPLNILNQLNGNNFLTVNKTGNVGINLGQNPNFENKDFKVIGDILFDSSNVNFHVKGSTQINDSVGLYTTKIGTNNSAGQVSLGRNEIVKLTTNSNLSANCDIICSKNIYLSGNQDIVGNLNIQGNLSALGTFTQLDTIVTITSSMSVSNRGTTTALVVTQTGNTDIADFRDESESILFIDNDKRVGILNNNPQYTLDVNGNIHTTENIRINGNKEIILGSDNENSVFDGASLEFEYLSNTNSRFIVKTVNEGNEPIVFRQSNGTTETNRLTIGTNGNIGVGYSLSSVESFDYKLDVYDDGGSNIRAIGNNSNSIGSYIQNTIASGRSWGILSSGGGPSPVGSFTIWDNTVSNARFVINPSGNVAIGQISASDKLEVNGEITSWSSVNAKNNNSGGESSLNLYKTDSANNKKRFQIINHSTNNFAIRSVNDAYSQESKILTANRTSTADHHIDNVKLYTGDQSRLSIISNGNVGIGTDSPTERLTVSGNISASGNISIGGTLLNIGSDTNLYRSATNTLKTDDSLEIVGTILVPDGSALTPSIANTGDTDNGIFFPATDTLAFTTSGVEKFRIDDGGGIWKYQATPSTKSQANSATALTLQEIQSGIITCTGSTVSHSLLLPPATALNTNSPPINSGIEFSVINVNSSAAVSLAQNTGLSIGGIGGSVIVAANTSARFTLRKANNTPIFALYRLS